MTDTKKEYYTPAAAQITIEEIKNSGHHYFTAGQLKELLNKVDDDTVVAIHRVEDSYFKSFGANGWKAIKALWDVFKISPHRLEAYQVKSDLPEYDPTLSEIVEENGEFKGKSYIDAIPAHQAILVSARGETDKKVLVITPHY